jgi:choline trimethylamine-lyase
VCHRIPAEPARTFQEALQAVWFSMVLIYIEENGPGISFGHFDRYVYPYLKHDLDSGLLTREEALELLECFFLREASFVWLHNSHSARFQTGYIYMHNLCVGGREASGKDATNDLSFLCLEAMKNVHTPAPSMSAILHEETPDDFLLAICDLIREGIGFPALHNDDVGVKAMLGLGHTLEEARDWTPIGCVEPTVPGKTMYWSDGGSTNFGIAVEFALTRGYSRKFPGERLGVDTGDPREFQTFDDFMTAVKTQLRHLIEHMVISSLNDERCQAEYMATPFASSILTGCVENAVDMSRGGAMFNQGPALLGIGLADISNSLAAVKKLVYEDRSVSWDTLLKALEADFEGYETVQALMLNKVPKWGNDDDYVDDMAREISAFWAEEIHKFKGNRGSTMMSALYPVSANVPLGAVIGALPSGRKAWTPLADGVSPQPGTDKSPTAVFKSVAKIRHEDHGDGTLLNMKFTPQLLEGEAGLRRLADAIRAYFSLGGYHVQFNVVSAKTLRDAQAHPEEYKGLVVRVAGYSAYFTELSRGLQDALIDRTEHTNFN